MEQYYRMTLKDVIADYQLGLISATALLYYFLKIRLKAGWKVTLHQREICAKLGISKSQFYQGICRLKQRVPGFSWEAPNGVVVQMNELQEDDKDASDKFGTDLTNSEPSCDSVKPSDKIVKSSDKIVKPSDKTATATPPKPPENKVSEDPPYSYQIFIKSLSDRGRKDFLNFVKEKIDKFDPPINDIEGWLAGRNKAGQNRWEIYYQKFVDQQERQMQQAHKRRVARNYQQEWEAEIDRRRAQSQQTWELSLIENHQNCSENSENDIT